MVGDARAALLERYVAAQLAGERREALRLILDEGLGAGFTPPDLMLSVITPAQHRVGELWRQGRISVAVEHLATAISALALARLHHHLPQQPRNGHVVTVACVEGERHELGAHVVADFLEMAGFDVRFLGADVPTAGLLAYVREHRPSCVVLSCVLPEYLPALRDAVRELRRTVGDDLPVAVGGAAVSERDFAADPRLLCCAGVADLLERLPQMLGSGPSGA